MFSINCSAVRGFPSVLVVCCRACSICLGAEIPGAGQGELARRILADTGVRGELMRVLAPLGVAHVKTGGGWTKTVKPRPAQIARQSRRRSRKRISGSTVALLCLRHPDRRAIEATREFQPNEPDFGGVHV